MVLSHKLGTIPSEKSLFFVLWLDFTWECGRSLEGLCTFVQWPGLEGFSSIRIRFNPYPVKFNVDTNDTLKDAFPNLWVNDPVSAYVSSIYLSSIYYLSTIIIYHPSILQDLEKRKFNHHFHNDIQFYQFK